MNVFHKNIAFNIQCELVTLGLWSLLYAVNVLTNHHHPPAKSGHMERNRDKEDQELYKKLPRLQ